MKKILSLLLAAVFLMAVFPSGNVLASEFIIENGTLVSYTGTSNVVNIPAEVYRIGEDSFSGMSFITSVNFHDSIVAIGRRAFRNCTGLTSVNIPPRVTTLSTDVFSGCTSLRNVYLGDYVSTIGAGAFQSCPIGNINLPYSLKSIGINAFEGNTMTSVTIPSTVIAIGDFAFGKDTGLIIKGVKGTRAEAFAQTFKHRFEAVSEPSPLPVPPPLPNLDLPTEKLHDNSTSGGIYMGTGEPPADYAVPAVNFLMKNTVIDDKYYDEYKKEIDREECVYYIMQSYFALMGLPVVLDSSAPPFSDTADKYVTKARELELVSGISPENFAPRSLVTREQMTAYFMRLLRVCQIQYNTANLDHIIFADHSLVSAWAMEDVRRAYHLGLINGTGGNNMSPLNNITREQVFTMLYNMFENLNKIQNFYTRGSVIDTPSLMYSGIGRHPEGHIDEAYYSTPSVLDINGDGRLEIISSAYAIYSIDAATGNINWKIPSGYDRSNADVHPIGRAFADIITKDINNDGAFEIVTGHSVSFEGTTPINNEFWQGVLAVYDSEGYFKSGWPKRLPKPVTSVVVYDLDGDGFSEIIAGTSGETSTSVWVFDAWGNLMDGWPQLNDYTDTNKNTDLSQNTGYQYGIFNNNIAVGDINGDGAPEIVVPSDLQFLCAYDIRGNLIKANPVFGGRSWGRVGTWEDYEFEKMVENEGWGLSVDWRTNMPIDLTTLPREKRNLAVFTNNRAIISDVDGNGINEVVVVGTVNDRAFPWPELPIYETPFIFNGDRTRFKTDKYDWTSVPHDTGKVLTTDWLEMELCAIVPVVADINFDGRNEILYPSASGKVFCFDLEQNLLWSYWVCDDTTKEIASPLTVCDINGDGLSEIIFTTIAAKASKKPGSLVILDSRGNEIQKIQLPPSLELSLANGSIAKPVIMDIDHDGVQEIVLNTHLSGVTVYKINLR